METMYNIYKFGVQTQKKKKTRVKIEMYMKSHVIGDNRFTTFISIFPKKNVHFFLKKKKIKRQQLRPHLLYENVLCFNFLK